MSEPKTWAALGVTIGLLLSACSPSQINAGVGVAQAINTGGAVVAGVVQPAMAIPAGLIAGALNGAASSIGAALGASSGSRP